MAMWDEGSERERETEREREREGGCYLLVNYLHVYHPASSDKGVKRPLKTVSALSIARWHNKQQFGSGSDTQREADGWGGMGQHGEK